MNPNNTVLIGGVTAQGRRELKKHRDGGTLTRKQSMLAKCYECCCGYEDGKVDCNIPDCPIYPFMPFRKLDTHKTPPSRTKTKGLGE